MPDFELPSYNPVPDILPEDRLEPRTSQGVPSLDGGSLLRFQLSPSARLTERMNSWPSLVRREAMAQIKLESAKNDYAALMAQNDEVVAGLLKERKDVLDERARRLEQILSGARAEMGVPPPEAPKARMDLGQALAFLAGSLMGGQAGLGSIEAATQAMEQAREEERQRRIAEWQARREVAKSDYDRALQDLIRTGQASDALDAARIDYEIKQRESQAAAEEKARLLDLQQQHEMELERMRQEGRLETVREQSRIGLAESLQKAIFDPRATKEERQAALSMLEQRAPEMVTDALRKAAETEGVLATLHKTRSEIAMANLPLQQEKLAAEAEWLKKRGLLADEQIKKYQQEYQYYPEMVKTQMALMRAKIDAIQEGIKNKRLSPNEALQLALELDRQVAGMEGGYVAVLEQNLQEFLAQNPDANSPDSELYAIYLQRYNDLQRARASLEMMRKQGEALRQQIQSGAYGPVPPVLPWGPNTTPVGPDGKPLPQPGPKGPIGGKK